MPYWGVGSIHLASAQGGCCPGCCHSSQRCKQTAVRGTSAPGTESIALPAGLARCACILQSTKTPKVFLNAAWRPQRAQREKFLSLLFAANFELQQAFGSSWLPHISGASVPAQVAAVLDFPLGGFHFRYNEIYIITDKWALEMWALYALNIFPYNNPDPGWWSFSAVVVSSGWRWAPGDNSEAVSHCGTRILLRFHCVIQSPSLRRNLSLSAHKICFTSDYSGESVIHG